jgi:hypothetical protein
MNYLVRLYYAGLVFLSASCSHKIRSLVMFSAVELLKVPDLPLLSITGLKPQPCNRVHNSPIVSIVFFISSVPLFKELVDGTSNDEV